MARTLDYSSVPDWQETAEEQKRLAADGCAYTEKEFFDYYGPKASELWSNAEIAESLNSKQSPDAAPLHLQEIEDEQKRVAWDGPFYGALSKCWKAEDTLLDHSNSATTSQQSQSVNSTTLGLHHPQEKLHHQMYFFP